MLPRGIDYSVYNSTSGMSTKHWGPACWSFLFTSILGHYPVSMDKRDPAHVEIATYYYHLFKSFTVILPCVYCRDSFKEFIEDMPIDEFLVGRMELMYWVYLIKDKVNNKLITQERRSFDKLRKELYERFKFGRITRQEYDTQLNVCKQESFSTLPTPSFQEVLDKYESLRAVCSTEAKTCSLKN